MVDQCTCCNGCSSRRQLSSYPSYSFSKKLLVAVSLVVIVAMCLMPTEAQPMGHKRRHRGSENIANPAKDTVINDNKRHQNHRANKMTRRPKPALSEMYSNETRKLMTKLRNTRRFYNEYRKEMEATQEQSEIKQHRNVIPSWLPTVNFVEIHFHNYNRNSSRSNGASVAERRYAYMMPKFYKSLTEYEEIFNELLNAETIFYDDPHNTYKKKRKQVIQNTLYKLSNTIQEVNLSMEAVNLPVPPFSKKLDISSLAKKVDYIVCIKNDYFALRGYGNLINNWFLEFKCPRGTRMNKKMCRDYENKLNKKIKNRNNKKLPKALQRH